MVDAASHWEGIAMDCGVLTLSSLSGDGVELKDLYDSRKNKRHNTW